MASEASAKELAATALAKKDAAEEALASMKKKLKSQGDAKLNLRGKISDLAKQILKELD